MSNHQPLQIIKQWGKREGKSQAWLDQVDFLWWVCFEFTPKELRDKKEIQK